MREATIELRCSEHNETLKVVDMQLGRPEKYEGIIILVTPCEQCIKDAIRKGIF